MRIIVTGATGLAGAEVVRQAILDEDVTEITALVRKPLSIQHEKLTTILHHDFLDYSKLTAVFKNIDCCIWCLGISQTHVNKVQYNCITYDYTLAAANAMIQANPAITFMFLSGEGAMQNGKSNSLFGRVKGKTEKDLSQLPLKKLFISRPAGIKPIHKNPSTAFLNKLVIPFYPLVELIAPRYVISSVQLAKAMLKIVKQNSEKVIWSNTELKNLAQ